MSSAFAFADAPTARAAFQGESDDRVYGRWGNPTVEALEKKLAALEGGEAAVATASGMTAIAGTLLSILSAGDHVVAPQAMYAESARLLRERLPRFGIETTFVDGTDIDAYESAIRPQTRILYAETPANPTLAITDLSALAALASKREVTLVVDNTFATPVCQRPLQLGAHVVVHSLTKALCGHGDAIGGVVVASQPLRDAIFDTIVKGLGGILPPLSAFLISRGIKTLPLRIAQAQKSAATIARFLEAHPRVERVFYPGLETHPGYAIAARQMSGFGTLLSFSLAGDGVVLGERVLSRVGLITHAVSLGDTRSLITHPASTTASTMPPADRLRAGITDGLLRLSVGIEHTDDLLADLEQALK